ncbi:MAG: transcription-repair coupling factor [Anaerolineae bacterium]|nr:transcription-repair coupling factor [Anaerolineae bacterium]
MQLNGLLSFLRQAPRYQDVLTALRAGQPVADQRVLRAARPAVAGALAGDLARPTLIVASQVERAYNIAEQLPVWLPDQPVYRFLEPSSLFYDRTPWATLSIRARLAALGALCPPPGLDSNGPAPVIVTSALALMARTLPVREFRAATRMVRAGTQADQEKLLRAWLAAGYTPVSVVTEPGTFSRRGGIVDVFPISAAAPVRLEFFGDEIESLRAFDPASQRSTTPLDVAVIFPAREALPKYASGVAERLAEWFASLPRPEDDVTSPAPDEDDLRAESAFPTIEFYMPFFYGAPASLLDYLPDDAFIVVDDWAALEDCVSDLETQAVTLREERLKAGQIPPDTPLPYFTWDSLRDGLRARHPLHLGGVGLEMVEGEESGPLPTFDEPEDAIGDLFTPGPRYGGQLRPFIDLLRRLRLNGERPVVVSNQAQRLSELWRDSERGPRIPPRAEVAAPPSGLTFVEGTLAEGWTLAAGHVHLLTDAEIFGWKRPEPRRHPVMRAISPEAYFADMAVGDVVVHVEYGIGRFVGLQKRVLEGVAREYLVIQYAGTDMLYVPIHQADRLSRYVGADDRDPPLSKLGSAEWTQTREAARRAAEEVARELLDLYARRASVEGHAFAPDSPWQAELEASFPYVETDDQLRVLAEVKADMERPTPMDRLICGDVGYGKTEIALRAAFKVVMDGKQVAILVPTTVLAQQHFNTFSQRLAAFPVKVEMLSRFRSPREQRDILAQTARGEVDILIGTHRILQEDVHFRDLGLLIIDEEQRFGVTHKERFKQMRAQVDVLTMTATPIPRTLYMSLAGIRDISMISTPPAERLPVLTHVGPYDEKIVRQAILRELDRGGQIFYVHNRVSTISPVHEHLSRLAPEARIVVGHGQMDEDELEKVMTRFAGGEADILLSTTIIESGLDIPNANTIIIDRADTHGLAQLYQLRGRVGRGAYRGYAYLFYPRHAHLNDEARARLDTIAEQTELGAGLSIAMRDLEIRGAGELLGTRQSGYIATVGFHLYTQLLAQAVQRQRAEQRAEHKAAPRPAAPGELGAIAQGAGPAITIDLPVPAFVPVEFMPDMAMRLQFYRRLADMTTLPAVDDLEVELEDRFGPLPPEVEGLLFQMRVKLMAQKANVVAITADENQVAVRLPYLATINRADLQRYLGHGARVSRVAVWVSRDESEENDWRQRLIAILERLQPLAENAEPMKEPADQGHAPAAPPDPGFGA